jgi:hypothetical protein
VLATFSQQQRCLLTCTRPCVCWRAPPLMSCPCRYWVPNPAFARRFKLPGGAKKTSADDELAMVTAASHSTAGTAGAGGGIAKPGKAFDGGPRLRPASSAGRQQQQFAAARGGASSSGCGDYPSDCSSPYSSGGSSSSSGSGSIAVNVVIDGCGSSCSAASLAGCVGGGLLHGAPQAAALSTSKRELELLKGVSGFAVPGKLMALMGGSGAGKVGESGPRELFNCEAGPHEAGTKGAADQPHSLTTTTTTARCTAVART